MFTIQFNSNEYTSSLEKVKKLDQRVPAAVGAGLKLGLAAVVKITRNNYLNGPRPIFLGVRTGKLRASIAASVEVNGDEVTGTIGTDVSYGAYHEFGFHGTVRVRNYHRNQSSQGGLVTVVMVRAHDRRMDYAGRSYVRPALDDGEGIILSEIKKALAAL